MLENKLQLKVRSPSLRQHFFHQQDSNLWFRRSTSIPAIIMHAGLRATVIMNRSADLSNAVWCNHQIPHLLNYCPLEIIHDTWGLHLFFVSRKLNEHLHSATIEQVSWPSCVQDSFSWVGVPARVCILCDIHHMQDMLQGVGRPQILATTHISCFCPRCIGKSWEEHRLLCLQFCVPVASIYFQEGIRFLGSLVQLQSVECDEDNTI